MPDSLFSITLDIDFALNNFLTDMEEDLYLIPDLNTIRVIPWKETPTASVICHMLDDDDKPTSFAPRQILIDILKLYEAIAQLMGLGKEPDQEWFDIYDSFLLNAHVHAVSEEEGLMCGSRPAPNIGWAPTISGAIC